MNWKQPVKDVYTYEFIQKIIPGVHFPARSTIIKLEQGLVVIISPGPFDSSAVEAIKNLGDRFIVIAPNLFHHFYFLSTASLFPEAQLYGPKALGKKLKKLAGKFTDLNELPKEVLNQLATRRMEGNKSLQEWVFFHKASRTLVLTDLVFNMSNKPFLTRLILKMAGAYNQLAQSKLVKVTVNDKQQFTESLKSLSDYDFETLIMAHGEIVHDPENWKQFAANYEL